MMVRFMNTLAVNSIFTKDIENNDHRMSYVSLTSIFHIMNVPLVDEHILHMVGEHKWTRPALIETGRVHCVLIARQPSFFSEASSSLASTS